MIYLKDEKAGVTVEDDVYSIKLTVVDRSSAYAFDPLYVLPDQADALLRGLLRWKLETLAAECVEPAWNARWQAIRAWFEGELTAWGKLR